MGIARLHDEEFVGYTFDGPPPQRQQRLWFLDRHLAALIPLKDRIRVTGCQLEVSIEMTFGGTWVSCHSRRRDSTTRTMRALRTRTLVCTMGANQYDHRTRPHFRPRRRRMATRHMARLTPEHKVHLWGCIIGPNAEFRHINDLVRDQTRKLLQQLKPLLNKDDAAD